MGRLIIHIGTHKTGTTSIQRALQANHGLLRRRGIRYPDNTLIGLRPHYAHIGVANGLASDHPEITPDLAARFLVTVAQQAPDYDATLISAESMYRQTLGEVPPQAAASPLQYWAMREAYIARVRELTGPAEIALVLRRQCDFAESMYQEHVKVTRYAADFRRFLQEFWFHFCYLEQFQAWARHFDRVHVVPFEGIKGDQIVRRFLQRLGLKPGRLAMMPSQNVGLPHDAVILKRELNTWPLGRVALSRIVAQMSSDVFREAVSPGPRSFFDSLQAKHDFQAGFSEDNCRLAELAGVSVDELFPPPAASCGTYRDSLDDVERERLLGLIDSTLLKGGEPSDDSDARRRRRRRLARQAAAAPAAESDDPADASAAQPPQDAAGAAEVIAERIEDSFEDPPAFSSAAYWESRYRRGGNSGPGSYGRLAEFKSEVLNGFLLAMGVESMIDFGCGDGNQLTGLHVPRYLGVDVSDTILERCRTRWADDPLKSFMSVDAFDRAPQVADLSLSMDVIFHLVEDEAFERYMARLFASARRWVVIYSSDREQTDHRAPHVRQRAFSPWIARHAPDWSRWRRIANAHAFDPLRPGETSLCDFHVYRR